MDKSVAKHAGVLIALSVVIASVLEAVARLSNLLNTPIDGIFLAAGTISASMLVSYRRGG